MKKITVLVRHGINLGKGMVEHRFTVGEYDIDYNKNSVTIEFDGMEITIPDSNILAVIKKCEKSE